MDALRRTTLVRSSVEHTFDVFTGRLSEWWPRVPYSLGGDRVVGVSLDGRVGGRVHETWDDGRLCSPAESERRLAARLGQAAGVRAVGMGKDAVDDRGQLGERAPGLRLLPGPVEPGAVLDYPRG